MVTEARFKQQLPDPDPDETREWVEALDTLVRDEGKDRAQFIIRKVLKRSRMLHTGLPELVEVSGQVANGGTKLCCAGHARAVAKRPLDPVAAIGDLRSHHAARDGRSCDRIIRSPVLLTP